MTPEKPITPPDVLNAPPEASVPPSHVVMARTTWREALALLACLTLFSTLHFLRPNRATHQHAAHLVGPIVYAYNADSADYVWLALRFPQGLATERGKIRRMRPLYPFLGWAAYQPLRLLEPLVPARAEALLQAQLAESGSGAIWAGIRPRQIIMAWLGEVGVNFLLVWLALGLLFAGLRVVFARRVAFLLALLPGLHFNTIDFLLVPHTEAFNLLVPALLVWTIARWQTGEWERQRAEGAGQIGALEQVSAPGREEEGRPPGGARLADALTSTGNSGRAGAFALGVFLLGKALLYPIANWMYEAARTRRPGAWRDLAVSLLLFAAPTLLYGALIKATGLAAYNHEITHYRQFIWMLDELKAGHGGDIPHHLAFGLVTTLRQALLGFLAPYIVMGALILRRNRSNFALPALYGRHIGVYTLAGLAFWTLSGFYMTRLTLTLFPLPLFALGTLAIRKTDRPAVWLTAALILEALLHLAGAYLY